MISQAAWEDLEWWRSALASDVRRPARYTRSGTLISTWGDGSGTGAGGTLHTTEADQPTFHVGQAAMWLGQWRPFVHHCTSNYKEMRTLLTALELIEADPDRKAACFGTTLFYFTDNSVTYFAVQAGSSKLAHLQLLVRRIKLLELRLGCLLEVVHVPGVVMIDQGTDDLSRGVYRSSTDHDGYFCRRPERPKSPPMGPRPSRFTIRRSSCFAITLGLPHRLAGAAPTLHLVPASGDGPPASVLFTFAVDRIPPNDLFLSGGPAHSHQAMVARLPYHYGSRTFPQHQPSSLRPPPSSCTCHAYPHCCSRALLACSLSV
jgi:hypothetical protein